MPTEASDHGCPPRNGKQAAMDLVPRRLLGAWHDPGVRAPCTGTRLRASGEKAGPRLMLVGMSPEYLALVYRN